MRLPCGVIRALDQLLETGVRDMLQKLVQHGILVGHGVAPVSRPDRLKRPECEESQCRAPDEQTACRTVVQKPKRFGAKYLDTMSGRVRLAAIPSNEATQIDAFIKANIAPGTTLASDGHASYLGLADYRHDPRVVGSMAGHVPLKWIHRVFAL